jgi:hypothetical protein
LETDDPARLGYRAPLIPLARCLGIRSNFGIAITPEGVAVSKNGGHPKASRAPFGFDRGFWIFHTSRNARTLPGAQLLKKSPRSCPIDGGNQKLKIFLRK